MGSGEKFSLTAGARMGLYLSGILLFLVFPAIWIAFPILLFFPELLPFSIILIGFLFYACLYFSKIISRAEKQEKSD